jgi:hypothetical protein
MPHMEKKLTIKLKTVNKYHHPLRYPTKGEMELYNIACENALLNLKTEIGDEEFNKYAQEAIELNNGVYDVDYMLKNTPRTLYHYILILEAENEKFIYTE